MQASIPFQQGLEENRQRHDMHETIQASIKPSMAKIGSW